jgi:hypothetical protein
MVSLTNRTRTEMIVLNLPPECGTVAHMHRSLDQNPATGDVGVRIVERQLCDSVHIAVGETSRPLPDCVADMPEVKAYGARLVVRKLEDSDAHASE